MKLTITESFLFNDFELLFAAEDEDGNPYIGQYMGETSESIKYALIPVSKESLELFAKEEMDLRTLLLERCEEEWYRTDMESEDEDEWPPKQERPFSETGWLCDSGYHPYWK